MDVRQGFQVAPGKCFTCSNSDPSLWVIDTCSDHPTEVRRFRIYICVPCVQSMAKSLEAVADFRVVSVDAMSVMATEVARAQGYLDRAEKAETLLRSLGESLAAAEGVTA